jgi:hypothetical protein
LGGIGEQKIQEEEEEENFARCRYRYSSETWQEAGRDAASEDAPWETLQVKFVIRKYLELESEFTNMER